VFPPGRPFQPSVIFVSKSEAYPSKVALLEYLYLSTFQVLHSKGRLLVTLANITVECKGLPGINTLAYFAYYKLRRN
jgi:hypothetical protein